MPHGCPEHAGRKGVAIPPNSTFCLAIAPEVRFSAEAGPTVFMALTTVAELSDPVRAHVIACEAESCSVLSVSICCWVHHAVAAAKVSVPEAAGVCWMRQSANQDGGGHIANCQV
eukprot:jgi/Ulvmu1/7832/UM004_0061.1